MGGRACRIRIRQGQGRLEMKMQQLRQGQGWLEMKMPQLRQGQGRLEMKMILAAAGWGYDPEHAGNIGSLFGNWGARAKEKGMRDHTDTVLNKNPAMVIGLAECQEATEEQLKKPGGKGDPMAAPHTLESRNSYQYQTCRPLEESTVLAAFRKQEGSSIAPVQELPTGPGNQRLIFNYNKKGQEK